MDREMIKACKQMHGSNYKPNYVVVNANTLIKIGMTEDDIKSLSDKSDLRHPLIGIKF